TQTEHERLKGLLRRAPSYWWRVKYLLITFAMAAALAGSSRIGGAGVTITLPRGWHAIPFMVPPPSMQVNDPVTRIVAASAPIDFGRGCNEVDYKFASTAVAIVVLEWVQPSLGRFQPRPARFTSKTLPVRRPPAIECFNGPGGAVEF